VARVSGLQTTGCLALLASLGTLSTAHADVINDKIDISAGIFLIETSTTFRVDGTARTGTDVNLNRDLGLGNTNSFRFDGYWRFATRHKIRIEYFDEVRSAEHTINRQISIGDTTFDVNTQLSARVKTVNIEGAYEYAFMRGETYELAGSVGVYDMYYKFSASAVGQTTNASASARADFNGPLPVIGLHYLWQFTPEWNLDVLAEFFALSVNPYTGTLQNYNVSVVYMPTKHFGAGLGWNEFILNTSLDSHDFNGTMSLKYGGLRFYVKYEY
jgi:hypothetical protein